ncbi:hydrolase [Gordonia phage Secretariat]|uniref:Uncharacterized protein n=1 Tax=Gordonia phage Secretariat TaxID=2725616 RepID=A0A6M3T9M1_9CAUD|nr:hydrolase [Gordonia phage Secretariat]QJD49584.1 hypothetical protein SEA_SECRETARIAT_6 [Gordonia phage Secretariat]
MTFLQAALPDAGKRIYHDFNDLPNGELPLDWNVRVIQAQGPEVYNGYVRAATTTSLNSNSRSVINYNEKVNTDDQIMRGTTASAMNGLLSGIFLRSDAYMMNCVVALMSTGASSERGILLIQNGNAVRKATMSAAPNAIGDVWQLKAEGDLYTLVRNPDANGNGGTEYARWNDTIMESWRGPEFRYGGFFVNSDRNIIGTRNWGAGLDNYDFRDLSWVA